MLQSARSYRVMLVVCATQWLAVGLELGSLLAGTEPGDSARIFHIVLFSAFFLSGLSFSALLWLSPPSLIDRTQHNPT